MDYMKIILWGNIFGSVGQETSGVAQFLKRSNSASYSWGCFIFTLWSDDTQNQTLCSLITIFQTQMTRKPWCLLDFFQQLFRGIPFLFWSHQGGMPIHHTWTTPCFTRHIDPISLRHPRPIWPRPGHPRKMASKMSQDLMDRRRLGQVKGEFLLKELQKYAWDAHVSISLWTIAPVSWISIWWYLV